MRQSNEFIIDGTPDNAVTDTQGNRSRADQNVAYIPTVDATQEFRIVTNFYDAQYGRTGGGVISVSTKSGSNDYHGTIYEFMRRYQWDANNIAANAAGRPVFVRRPVTGENLGGNKLDQYGILARRPAGIPKVYDGKDKTFFSFAFENYRESTPSPAYGSVPTALERQGNFSQYRHHDLRSAHDTRKPELQPGSGSRHRIIRSSSATNFRITSFRRTG